MHLKSDDKRLSWLKFFKPVRRRLRHSEPQRRISELQVGQILPLGYIAILCRIFCRTPYIVYIHGLDVLQQQLSIWKKFWIWVIFMFSRQIVTNSKFTKNRVAQKYKISFDKIKVQYPIVDVKRIEKLAEIEKLSNEKNKKIILSVGRLVERKGFDKVIQALKELRLQPFKNGFKSLKAKFQYLIIGEGPDRVRLESLVKKYDLSNSVKFLGAVKSPEIYQYYKNCDVFIMPSREINGDVEGFGIVFLEAAVFKKPVIGGRSGGVSEAVINNQTGILVDPLDVDEIAQTLVKLLQNEQLASKLGQQAYKRVCEKFSI